MPPAALAGGSSERLAPGVAIAIGVLVASTFTVILNEMLMAVALPRVMDALGITASTAQWLTTGYMLTMAVVIPATGVLNERFRMRTVYTLGMALFLAGTVIAAVSPGFVVLLVGRIVQAVGTAILLPLGFTAVATLVPPSRNGRMMALLTVATSAAPALGPTVAGAILSLGSWRWLFIAIVPIAALCLVVGDRMLRVPGTPRQAKLDLLSLLLSAVGFASLVYGLASVGEGAGGHAPVSPWTAMAIGVVGIALFVLRQVQLQKIDRAQLDLRPFGIRTFSVSALVAVFFMTPATGMMTLMPVVLQTSYGLSPLQTGLFMLPGGLTITLVSIIVGRFYDRMGPRPLMVTGAIIDAAGLLFLSTLAPGTPIGLLLATYMFIIVGQALLWTPVFAASLGSLDKHLLPHGSAIINTIQQLTGAAGIAITFSIMAAASAGYVTAGEGLGPAIAHGAQRAYLVGSGFVVVALVMALLIPRKVAATGLPMAAH
ncbi:multidrug efflux MFS transporter [Rubellimicrobium rubrum]|uniref:Multidrug efflux MFS transporter n=2 Tax=Rubellimicrobium rubrum TaxID=2585369 RepID=A0A5C4MW53_9RHOB|nr:multidrug efflux MFS transporter [Rubellimicrobium rubrum]